MHDTFFEYDEHILGVSLPDGGPLHHFLVSYFQPFFKVGITASSAAGVFVRINVHVAPEPQGAPPLDAGEWQDIDRSKAFLRCRGRILTEGGFRWIRMDRFPVLVRVARSANCIDIWGPREDALRVPLLRIIEDLTVNRLENSGAVLLHAAGVVAGGRAVLAAGNKGAGKTTSLCRWLSAFTTKKMANDNVCLKLDEGRVQAVGWPAFFKAEVATLAAHEELAADYPVEHRDRLVSERAVREVYWKVALYPSQAAERFDTEVQRAAPLSCIVLPHFSVDKPVGLEELRIADVAEEMEAYLQGSHNPNHNEWLLYNPVDRSVPKHSLRRILKQLDEEGIPVYRLHWGPSIDDLFARIPQLRCSKKSIRRCFAADPVNDGYPPLPEI